MRAWEVEVLSLAYTIRYSKERSIPRRLQPSDFSSKKLTCRPGSELQVSSHLIKIIHFVELILTAVQSQTSTHSLI